MRNDNPNRWLLVDQSMISVRTSLRGRDSLPFPQQQLSLKGLNPFPESVFSYTLFLASCLSIWLLYLLLPRGFRKQYCRANRKRYSRRLDSQMPAAGYWAPVRSIQAQSMTPSFEGENDHNRHQSSGSAYAKNKRNFDIPTTINTPSKVNNAETSPPRSPPRNQFSRQYPGIKNPPSPEHPALKKIPSNKIIASTMERLQNRGIRLVAHGVHCDPKRVWISLKDDVQEGGGGGGGRGEPCVTWQTEFPRRVPDQSGQVSIVLMRGSLHTISLKNILYIDVGKKTHALQLANDLPDSMCLSLLTQNGSLDLQANSKLERDSLVSCFSMILDDIHEEDWRALYEASPEPSLVNSAESNHYNNNNNNNNNNNRAAGGKDMMLQLL
ncbi:hypothetical protein FRACYDRAFT_235488 [Fragilariopsis cylindrus CCMP1102]|uniref:Uncharacterized protein n=1 Tax=Fragilariopsis cylindrus CCMP1102 TaxID=635003 RepID=A0A1E7FMY1_9STRA|nr:hypothetical protein FRACYDRAFT_235488 [Fragilariopsis cylindrus CCMP1102]|eukprot:OEU19435.1 hypothetical protein FRACYDRAFT_235488 [Fragilariopsis cylindrus CCMP1102]